MTSMSLSWKRGSMLSPWITPNGIGALNKLWRRLVPRRLSFQGHSLPALNQAPLKLRGPTCCCAEKIWAANNNTRVYISFWIAPPGFIRTVAVVVVSDFCGFCLTTTNAPNLSNFFCTTVVVVCEIFCFTTTTPNRFSFISIALGLRRWTEA